MSTNTTKIDVLLKHPNGWPLTNVCFGVKPVRTGFLDNDVPIIEDRELVYKTDDQGYAQMELLPLPFPYVLTYSEATEEVPGYFVFYVPEIGTTVQFKDLVVSTAPAPPSDYGEQILAQIVAAKAQVSALVQEATTARDQAEGYAEASKQSATNSAASAASVGGARDQVLATQTALQAVLDSIMVAVVRIQAIDMQNLLMLDGHFLWVDNQNRLRIHTAAPVDKNTDGTIVGTQSA